MSVTLIGISGRKRCGKNTAASILREFLPGTPREVSFAHPIKQMTSIITGIPVEDFESEEVKQSESWLVTKDGYRYTNRELLQKIGTELFRQTLGTPNIWVDLALRPAYPGEVLIITDVRFPNEVEAIQKAGGVVLRVNRPGLVSTDTHPSETSLDDYPFEHVIENDGTMDSFHVKLRKWLKGL